MHIAKSYIKTVVITIPYMIRNSNLFSYFKNAQIR